VNQIPRTIGVLIATYRRPDDLLRCLSALKKQTLQPHDILVVVRDEDSETKSRLKGYPPDGLRIRAVSIDRPGSVAARNAGLDLCETDILAIIDDDTAPHPDWLSRVSENFHNDPALGGLGGRDRCFDGTAFDDRQEPVVGKIQWWGRTIGNHHLGFGKVREVDVLKGANMSFRAKAFEHVRFNTRLKGTGAQPSEDYCFSVDVKAQGWKLAYDPTALVDHYASRRDEKRLYVGVSAVQDEAAFRDFSYNQTLSIWNALSPLRRLAFLVWSCLVGTGVFPGLLQAVRFTPTLGIDSWRRFFLAQQGKMEAFRDLLLPAQCACLSQLQENRSL
jgi:GT2 family glycosyltransferase